MNLKVAKRRETSERHSNMKCRVVEVKVQLNKLSKKHREHLYRLFLEAKWMYNDILGSEDVFNYDTKKEEVQVFNKEHEKETRKIEFLSSQMKQSVKEKTVESIMGLAAKKKKGEKVGKLKFKGRYNSIRLKQFNVTYKLIDKKFLRLQGMKGQIRVRGLEQIPEGAEVTCANLIKRDKDFFLKITLFTEKEILPFKFDSVGIDFGIKTHLQLSDGTKFNVKVPKTKRLKALQKKLSRQEEARKHSAEKTNSKNKEKTRVLFRKENQKIQNQKDDQRKKVVSQITKNYETVCIQDENIKGWHSGLFGKQLQDSCLGGIISDLKNKSHTLKLVDRFFASTQTCPQCGRLTKHGLEDRTYVCGFCGYSSERDIHAARNIWFAGISQVGTECIDPKKNTLNSLSSFSKPVEKKTSRVYRLDPKFLSMKQDAPML